MLIAGLMSGTSMDAIDAALVEIGPDDSPRTLRMRVRHFVMAPLDPALRERVRDLLPPHQGSTAGVCEAGDAKATGTSSSRWWPRSTCAAHSEYVPVAGWPRGTIPPSRLAGPGRIMLTPVEVRQADS